MNSFEKLSRYKQRLHQWVTDKASGHSYPEPKPDEYGLKNAPEAFMAQRVRDQILNPVHPLK